MSGEGAEGHELSVSLRCPQDGVNPGKKSSKFNQDCTICRSCRWMISGSAVPQKPENRIKWPAFGRTSTRSSGRVSARRGGLSTERVRSGTMAARRSPPCRPIRLCCPLGLNPGLPPQAVEIVPQGSLGNHASPLSQHLPRPRDPSRMMIGRLDSFVSPAGGVARMTKAW